MWSYTELQIDSANKDNNNNNIVMKVVAIVNRQKKGYFLLHLLYSLRILLKKEPTSVSKKIRS